MYLITLLKMEATKIIVVLKQKDVELILFFQNADADCFLGTSMNLLGTSLRSVRVHLRGLGEVGFFFVLFSYIFLSTQQHVSLWHSDTLQKSQCQEC